MEFPSHSAAGLISTCNSLESAHIKALVSHKHNMADREHMWNEIVVALGKHPGLKELKFEYDKQSNGIGLNACLALRNLLQVPGGQLRKLVLSNCGVGNEGVRSIFEPLCTGALNLTCLNISNGLISQEGCFPIVNLLKNSESKLSELNLSGNLNLRGGVPNIVNALKDNTKLTILNLDCVVISTEGCEAIAKILGSSNVMLKQLGLSCCGLNDETVAIIANALVVNTTVESLDLSCNHSISPEGICAIANPLRSPTSMLTDLNLSNSRTSDFALATIANALAANNRLNRLDITHNNWVTRFDVFSPVLCNSEGITSIVSSNHTLVEISTRNRINLPDVKMFLKMNRNDNKQQVICKKIMHSYFVNKINLDEFAGMPYALFPRIFEGLGKELSNSFDLCNFAENIADDLIGSLCFMESHMEDCLRLTAIFNLLRVSPMICIYSGSLYDKVGRKK